MRSVIITALFLFLSAKAFCQDTTSRSFSLREEYLQKSKNKKQTGFLLLGAGLTTMGIGVIIADHGDGSLNSLDKTASGLLLAGVGGLATLTSVFFFGASGHYKRRAAEISLHMEKTMQSQEKGFVRASFPAVRLNIAL